MAALPFLQHRWLIHAMRGYDRHRLAPPQRFTRFPLALKGRQNTDGGKQRAAPGHGQLITPPPCADGAREGEGGGRRLAGGYASLTPVCTLSPFQGLIILWQCKRKSVILGERNA